MAESITLQTSDSNVQQSDVLGRLSFAASNESSASDARLIGASIYAAAESDFTEISNATSLILATASSENAQEVARITSDGYLGINTNSPTYHLHVNGTIFGTSILENGNPVIISDITTAYGSDIIQNIISLTESEYNGITPSSGTLYIITDGSSATSLTGSGLTNYISKWNNSYELTNSLIYDNASGVGISNTNPLYTLDVSGTGNFTFLRSSGSPVIVSDISSASGSDVISNIISLTQSEYNAITPSSGTFYIISDAISSYIDGSGISNYIPKWSGVNYLTSGIIYDDGSSIGIGTNSPQATLDIISSASTTFKVGDTSSSQPFFFIRGDSAFLSAGFGRSSAQANCRLQYYSNPLTSGDYWIQDASRDSYSLTRVINDTPDTSVFKLENGSATFNNAFTLPSGDGSDGQALLTNGSGNVYWSNIVIGTGTNNYTSKWINSNTLTSGIIYDDGSNIGIGTSSPSARLNIEGGNFIFNDSGDNWDFRIEGDSDPNLLFLDASNDTVNIGTGTSTGNKLLISVNNSRSYQHILASGGVATESSFARIANTSNVTSDSFAGLLMSATRSGSNVSQTAIISAISNNAALYQPNIVFTARNGNSTYAEMMRINHVGDVGIGTSTPLYKLDVVGSGNFSENVLVNGTPVSVSGHSHNMSDILINTVSSIDTSGTLTPNSDITDVYVAEGLTGDITLALPSGTPTNGQKLLMRFKDDGTARSITWTTSTGGYRAIGITLPTTTVSSKITYVGCIYNSSDAFWDVIAAVTQS